MYRYGVECISLPFDNDTLHRLVLEGVYLIAGYGTDTLFESVAEMLQAGGAQTHIIRMDSGRNDAVAHVGAPNQEHSGMKAFSNLKQKLNGEPVRGIIYLLPRVSSSEMSLHSGYYTQSLFQLLQTFHDELNRKDDHLSHVIAVTSLGGDFGLSGQVAPIGDSAGCLGLMKSVAREWPSVRCMALDMDPVIAEQDVVGRIKDEMEHDSDRAVEIGFDQFGNRITTGLVELPLLDDRPVAASLAEGSVIVATGGAYGITAECLKALSPLHRPHLILLGRSPLPVAEDPEYAAFSEPAQLRKYLLQSAMQAGQRPKPIEIERKVRNILKERQIRNTIAYMQEHAASVDYFSVDVRQREALSEVLTHIYNRYGQIDAVIHGAGVIEDKLLKEKPPEAFDRVFGTKVDSALALAELLKPEKLKCLVFFSSVAGRFGNVGQSDYSAANEVLNKLADHLNRNWPGRVVSINWGPWDSGMVSPKLKELYAERGIELIPMNKGVERFVQELSDRADASAEVVVTCSAEQIASGLGRA